jgi:hypothetical protein
MVQQPQEGKAEDVVFQGFYLSRESRDLPAIEYRPSRNHSSALVFQSLVEYVEKKWSDAHELDLETCGSGDKLNPVRMP